LQQRRQISSNSGLTTTNKDKESNLHDMEDLLEIQAHFTLHLVRLLEHIQVLADNAPQLNQVHMGRRGRYGQQW
jgi:hypothetical protein